MEQTRNSLVLFSTNSLVLMATNQGNPLPPKTEGSDFLNLEEVVMKRIPNEKSCDLQEVSTANLQL